MTHLLAKCITILGLILPAVSFSQTRSPELFDSRNAIINTAIPFAIGAQEAQQSLRGSFGWQTFQEGLVEGVYYRFDPDGYARFAPTPRLDQDQFEVVCVPRSFVCTAQKGALHVALNQRGQLQLQFENLGAGDQFFISDGANELPLPARILEPLDIRMESLLMSGGELLIKRNAQVVNKISLVGFSAVTAYIRWVAAGQDYSVLPRNWPIPNSATTADNRNVTQPDTWNRPTGPNQSVVPWPAVANIGQNDRPPNVTPFDPTRPLARILAAEDGEVSAENNAIGMLKAEIAVLNAQLRSIPSQQTASITPYPAEPRIEPEVLNRLEFIISRLDRLDSTLKTLADTVYANQRSLSAQSEIMSVGPGAIIGLSASDDPNSAFPLNPEMQNRIVPPVPRILDQNRNGNLATTPTVPTSGEAGVPSNLEMEILRIIQSLTVNGTQPMVPAKDKSVLLPIVPENGSGSQVVLERSVVEQILKELDENIAAAAMIDADESESPQMQENPQPAPVVNGDFKTLSDYFKSAAGNQ